MFALLFSSLAFTLHVIEFWRCYILLYQYTLPDSFVGRSWFTEQTLFILTAILISVSGAIVFYFATTALFRSFSASTKPQQTHDDVTTLYHRYLPHKRLQALLVVLLAGCLVLQLLVIAVPDPLLIALGTISIVMYFLVAWCIVAFWYDKGTYLLERARTPDERLLAEHTALWIIPLSRLVLEDNNEQAESDPSGFGFALDQGRDWEQDRTHHELVRLIAPTTLPAKKRRGHSEIQWSRFLRLQYLVSWVAYGIIIISCVGLLHFYSQMFGQAQPFFSLAQLEDMDSRTNYQPFQTTVQGETRNHVLLVVLDGLRLATSRDHSEWMRLLSDPLFVSHLVVSESQAALPTVSLPNWATLLTGLPPDGTGILGNVFVWQTSVDTFFHRLRRLDAVVNLTDLGPDADYDTFNATGWVANTQQSARVLIGSPSYVQLALPALTPLAGQGAIPVLLRDEGLDATTDAIGSLGVTSMVSGVLQSFAPLLNYVDSTTEFDNLEFEESDAIRTHLASRWIKESVPSLNLSSALLLHLECADHRGHAKGIDSTGYQRGVKLYAKMIHRLFSVAQSLDEEVNLTIVVTSDHGHVVAGGHGGVQDVLRRVPLLVYDRRIINSTATLDRAKAHARDVRKMFNAAVDVPTTVSMLLGVPAPRQTTGKWIEELPDLLLRAKGHWDASMRDLYETQRVLFLYFLIQAGISRSDIAARWNHNGCVRSITDFVLDRAAVYSAQCPAAPLNLTDYYQLAIYELHNLQESEREWVLITLVIRNFIAVSLVSVIVLLFFWWRFALFGDIAGDRAPQTRVWWCSVQTAWLWAWFTCALYIAVTMTVYHSTYAALGYPEWDSTQLHSNIVIPRFVLVVFIPGAGFMWLLFRVMVWLSLGHPSKLVFESRQQVTPHLEGSDIWVLYLALYQVWVWLFMEYYIWTYKVQVSVQKLRFRLFRFYCFLLAAAATLGVIVFILESVMGFYVPVSINVVIIAEEIWEFRFRALSFHAMCIPLLLGAIFYYTIALHAVWLSLNKPK